MAFLEFLYTDHSPISDSGDSVGILVLANRFGKTIPSRKLRYKPHFTFRVTLRSSAPDYAVRALHYQRSGEGYNVTPPVPCGGATNLTRTCFRDGIEKADIDVIGLLHVAQQHNADQLARTVQTLIPCSPPD